eukprot:scaffold100769_cov16-Tisochrysis_lutea.AAC.1
MAAHGLLCTTPFFRNLAIMQGLQPASALTLVLHVICTHECRLRPVFGPRVLVQKRAAGHIKLQ